MADITLTSSIRSNLLSLQNTANLLDRTSTRLSTGLKVNSALDNPGSFFTARGLSNRAADLTGLQDGIAQAIQTLKTADQGISSITKLVEQAKSIAEQAKETNASGTVSTHYSTSSAVVNATASTNATSAFAAITNAATLVVTVSNGTTLTITSAGKYGVASLATAISAADSAITATFNTTTDKFEITATAGTEVTFSGGANVFGATAVTFGTPGGADVATLQADYNKVLTQINELVNNGDTAYKGINLLKSTNLTVDLSENNSSITITGVDGTTTGLGLNTASWTSTTAIDTTITETETAVGTLRTFASSFGTDLSILQYREDYTKNLVNTLEDGAGQLVNANLEEESANLLALQTRQALGTQSLSIANQSQQSILSLFR